ncbi:MAG: DNA recombination protein RmuC, partial [Pseudomonadota bacterium]|nr:DNA recombination protein RmuC [Pseudomonadota bacterium]
MMNEILVAVLSTTIGIVFLALYMSYRARATQNILGEKIRFLESELTVKRTELTTRQEEARYALLEAKARETAAATRALDAEKRLQLVLEERGQLTAQIGRLDELKSACAAKDSNLQDAHGRITTLEKAKTAAEIVALSASQRAEAAIAKERETSEKVVAAKDDQIRQLQTFIVNARETLGTEFQALSSKLLKEASDELLKSTTLHTEHHNEQVSGMLKPVRETMDRLDQHVTESNQARLKAETLLDDQVKRLAGATEMLTSALKKPVVRGSWGETQLENALENAGLEAEIDYILQHSTDAEDGIKRTDAVINLPKGRKLVVDSKNLMESYFAWAATTDPDKKAELAEIHAKSLRGHIKALSGKEYWRRYEGLDCVILCVASATSGQIASVEMRDFELLRVSRRRSEVDEQTRTSTIYG